MVRINIVDPVLLSDQHLVAEYNEILMLLGYVTKYPSFDTSKIPKSYTLGKGHMLFFKNKLAYVKKRHEMIKKEMRRRGFKTDKTIALKNYPKALCNDWQPMDKDYYIIVERISFKINLKPRYYRYCGKYRDKDFFIRLLHKDLLS